ncbi:MAG: hypothetical protein ACE5IM_05360 [Nitrospinota bacterium]
MATIRLLKENEITGSEEAIVGRIIRRENKAFGIDYLSNIWRAMAHLPGYMEANWNRSRATMQRGKVPPVIKEMVASAVSIVNVCHY